MAATFLSEGHASMIVRMALPKSQNRFGEGMGGAKMFV